MNIIFMEVYTPQVSKEKTFLRPKARVYSKYYEAKVLSFNEKHLS